MGVSFEVQKAVYAAVTAAVTTHVPVPAVYDSAPQDAAFPFIEISRHIQTPDNLLSKAGTRQQVTLTVYSTEPGQRQILAIMDLIYTALDDSEIVVPGADFVRCDCERRDTARDQDGKTYVGSMIFAITYEQ